MSQKKWAKLKKAHLKKAKKLWKYWDSQGLTEDEVIAMSDYLLDKMSINELTGVNICENQNTRKNSKRSKKS